jgi:hypothetical protein
MKCGARPLSGKSFCPACGAQTNQLAVICVKCGTQLNSRPKPWAPITVGVVNIVSGIVNIVAGSRLFYLVIQSWDYYRPNVYLGVIHGIPFGVIGMSLSILMILFAVITVIGGIYALRRRYWILSFVSSILSVIVGCFWIFASVLGIIALIITLISKRDFNGKKYTF